MLSPPAARVAAMIDRFVRGQSFMAFWRTFMDFVGDESDAAAFTSTERAVFDQVYEWIYMGQAGNTTPDEAGVGLIGEAELRDRLRGLRWDGSDVAPV
jgi:hypothetical protein